MRTQSPIPDPPASRAPGAPGRRRVVAVFLVLLLLGAVARRLYGTVEGLPPVCPPPGPQPARIVSLSLGTDEILLDLVPPGRIRALTYVSVLPDYSTVADRARGVPIHTANTVEEILRLRPDLILATSFNHPEKIASLRAAGCAVVTISGFDSIDGIRRSVLEVADAVGEPERGRAVVNRMDDELRAIARRHPPPERRPRVMYAGPGNYSHGRGTTIHDLIVRAGGINAAEDSLTGFGFLSAEEWLSLRPDIVLRTSYTPIDPFLWKVLRMGGRPDGPVEIVLPFKLLTSVGPSVVEAVDRMAESLRKAAPRP